MKIRPCDVEIDKIFPFFFNNFGANHFPPCLSGGYSEGLDGFRLTMTPARTTTRRTYNQMLTERGIDSRQSRRLNAAWTEGVTAELCDYKMNCATENNLQFNASTAAGGGGSGNGSPGAGGGGAGSGGGSPKVAAGGRGGEGSSPAAGVDRGGDSGSTAAGGGGSPAAGAGGR